MADINSRPNFVVTIKRSRYLEPFHASFIVPLWFSKLDLRDYLYHAYNTRIVSVRSYVKQSRITQGKNHPERPQYKRWHRPRAIKHMTVELERPFAWPEEPESYKAWNMAEYLEANKEGEEMQESIGPAKDQREPSKDVRLSLREQAKKLLEGKEVWRPGVSKALS